MKRTPKLIVGLLAFSLSLPLISVTANEDTATLPPPKQAMELFNKAYQLLSSGKDIAALPFYSEAVSLAPDNGDIWQEYCTALRTSKHLQSAARACWRSIELGPNNPGPWANIANVFMTAKQWQASYEANIRGEKLAITASDKAHFESQFDNVGYWAWRAGNMNIAEKAFKHVLDRNPSNIKTMVDYGIMLLTQQELTAGRGIIEKAIASCKESTCNQVAQYGKAVLARVKETGALDGPSGIIEESYEALPPRFLSQPPPGKALDLKIDDHVMKTFPVQSIGYVNLTVPEFWHEEYKITASRSDDRKKLDIMLHPDDKSKFSILLTVFPIQEKNTIDMTSLKDLVDFAFEAMKKSAHADMTKPVEINSPQVQGYYFFATDKNALKKSQNQDDYPYVHSGHFKSGKALIVATAFSWENTPQFNREVIEMFNSLHVTDNAIQ